MSSYYETILLIVSLTIDIISNIVQVFQQDQPIECLRDLHSWVCHVSIQFQGFGELGRKSLSVPGKIRVSEQNKKLHNFDFSAPI